MASTTERKRGQLIARGPDRWLVSVYVGRDENGKRRYSASLVRGSKRAAQKELTRKLRETDTGTAVLSSRETVGQFLDTWTAALRLRVRTRTRIGYEEYLRRYVRPELGGVRLSQLSPERIRTVYASMSERGLGARTIRQTHAVLHAALEQAVRDRRLPFNPAARARDSLPRRERRERQIITPKEAGALVEALEHHPLGAYWLVLLTGGLRPAEALALRWSDLDGNVARVVRVVVERKGVQLFEEPKTSRSRRAVPLPSSTIRALQAHRRRQAEQRLANGAEYQDQGLIFATGSGKPYRQSNLHPLFKSVLTAAQLAPMRTYDLRHSCATLLLAAGEHPKVVQERLGHASITLTMDTYSHVLPGMQEEAAGKLERLVFGT